MYCEVLGHPVTTWWLQSQPQQHTLSTLKLRRAALSCAGHGPSSELWRPGSAPRRIPAVFQPSPETAGQLWTTVTKTANPLETSMVCNHTRVQAEAWNLERKSLTHPSGGLVATPGHPVSGHHPTLPLPPSHHRPPSACSSPDVPT